MEHHSSNDNHTILVIDDALQTNFTNSHSSSSSSTSTEFMKNNAAGSHQLGKFDYVRMNCLGELNDYFAGNVNSSSLMTPNATTLKKEYDLIVIALGIWEVVNPRPCLRINDTIVYDTIERLNKTLMTLFSAATPTHSSSNTQFAFRTVGFDYERHHELSYKMINATRVFFETMKHYESHDGTKSLSPTTTTAATTRNVDGNHDPTTTTTTTTTATKNNAGSANNVASQSSRFSSGSTSIGGGNFILVDWGSVISKRSFTKDRIHGDIKPHYGLEARLLFAQQLMHQLLMTKRPSTSYK
jgi:hypothetical protein